MVMAITHGAREYICRQNIEVQTARQEQALIVYQVSNEQQIHYTNSHGNHAGIRRPHRPYFRR